MTAAKFEPLILGLNTRSGTLYIRTPLPTNMGAITISAKWGLLQNLLTNRTVKIFKINFTMRHPFYPQKLALTSPTIGGRSVGIVLSRTKATELVCGAE
jgi:hypothetical protein